MEKTRRSILRCISRDEKHNCSVLFGHFLSPASILLCAALVLPGGTAAWFHLGNWNLRLTLGRGRPKGREWRWRQASRFLWPITAFLSWPRASSLHPCVLPHTPASKANMAQPSCSDPFLSCSALWKRLSGTRSGSWCSLQS